MRPLPDYRIEPPDVIQIEMLKLVPLPPYRAAVFDVLRDPCRAPADQPIDDYFMVEAEGTIDLGPPYGSVHVAGHDLDEERSGLEQVAAERASASRRLTCNWPASPGPSR